MNDDQRARLNALLDEFASAQLSIDDYGDYVIDSEPVRRQIVEFVEKLRQETEI